MPKHPSWKYLELIAALGDDAAVAELIRSEGFDPPSLKTIAGWRMRNSMPSRWLPLLVELAMERKIIDHISQLRKGAPARPVANGGSDYRRSSDL